MKRFKVLLITMFLLSVSCFAYALDEKLPAKLENHTKQGMYFSRRFKVFFRGVVNIVALPLEVPRTFIEERKKNPEYWEWSFVPRTLENVVGRGLSAVNDSIFLTFLRSADESDEPWSRRWELPDYPWRKNEEVKPEDIDRQYAYYTMIGVRG